MDLECTAVFQKVPEGYIAIIEEFPGANTQGASLEEARTNLREAVGPGGRGQPDLGPRRCSRQRGHQRATLRHGVKRRNLLRHLARHGCSLLREGGQTPSNVNRTAKKVSTIPRHNDRTLEPSYQGPHLTDGHNECFKGDERTCTAGGSARPMMCWEKPNEANTSVERGCFAYGVVVNMQVDNNLEVDGLGFGTDSGSHLRAKGQNSDGAQNAVALMR